MNEGIRQFRLDLREMQIKSFIRAKGQRLPNTLIELYGWLAEFEEYNLKLIQSMNDSMIDFAETCTRPIVISR
jgi:hypothetical protein